MLTNKNQQIYVAHAELFFNLLSYNISMNTKSPLLTNENLQNTTEAPTGIPTFAHNATHYHMILDKSGSMESHYVEILQALNTKFDSIRATQAEHPEIPIYVSLTVFNDEPELIFEQRPASELRPLTEADYQLGGMTALLDATGTVIERMQYLLRHDLEHHNANAMVVIYTDGFENASKRYTYDQIGRKIKQLGSDNRWTFTFVGADIDAWDLASRIQFNRSNVFSSKKAEVSNSMSFLSSEFSKIVYEKKLKLK